MLHHLVTEQQNVASTEIDRLNTEEMLAVINDADQEVAGAVAKTIPAIARAVDSIAERLQKGGRLYYIGAGTSGRLGVIDASEIPPTYNVPPDLIQGLIAGGDTAIRKSIEGAEDDSEQGKADLVQRGFNAGDALLGIAASGRTPYVLGGVALGRSLGALTIGLSCTPDSELARAVEIAITPLPGPEVITGSTRMRAGTATKLVLNMISTGVMIRLGYVYGNLMVNMQATNSKLTDRAVRIVAQIAGVSYDGAQRLLTDSGSVRTAIVMHRLGLSREDAEAKLASAKGRLREALGENKTSPRSGDKA
jgi:N-acetylmuramic acid 6-phosphate etherase